MKTFLEFIQEQVGCTYDLRTILDNLEEDDIIESVNDYSKEVAKQTLINVGEKAQDMQYYTDKQEQDILGFTHSIIQSCYAVPKQTILNESNIPKL